jgi:nickel-dependent lactate racemase
MLHSLKYGSQKIDLNLPLNAVNLEIKDPPYNIDKEKFLYDLLSKLPENPSRYSDVGIVVADKTRLCGYPDFLPWLLEALHERGAYKENIHIYIAYGTHPKQSEEESLKSYGPLFKEYHFIHHDCYEEDVFTELGLTRRGTPVRIRQDILNSSLIITFGAISHHYFAGYGGGRKLLFPGLADRKSVYANHSLFLDRDNRQLAKGCQPGNLEGNPVAEDLEEIDAMMPPKVSIHGILNSRGEVVQLKLGKSYKDFEEACSLHDSYYRANISTRYDAVLASSGGYPKDINFIQAHKSIHHAAAFVRDGGTLIILSECRDGIASDYFLKYLEAGSFENAFAILETDYEGNGGTALSMMTKTGRINIVMMTSLNEQLCKTLNVTKADKQLVQDILDNVEGSVAVIGNASLLVK